MSLLGMFVPAITQNQRTDAAEAGGEHDADGDKYDGEIESVHRGLQGKSSGLQFKLRRLIPPEQSKAAGRLRSIRVITYCSTRWDGWQCQAG